MNTQVLNDDGEIIEVGDYVWSKPEFATEIDIIWVTRINPWSVDFLIPADMNNTTWSLPAIKRYHKFPPEHPIHNLPFEWVHELLVGKVYQNFEDIEL